MTPFTPPDFAPAIAEMFLLAMTLFIVVVDLFLPKRWRIVTYALAQFALLGCAVLTVGFVQATGGDVIHTFNGMYVSDVMGAMLKLATYISVSTCLVYTRRYLEERNLLSGEFIALLLFATLGMMVMISASHFLSLYIGLELLSLCLYALVALNRDSAASTEAAMKYFVLGALASGLLLYGM